jgi:hypothetical protein
MSFIDFSSFDVNAAEYDEDSSFDLIPAGWYQMFISKAELRPTKSGGSMISVTYDISGPTHQGRKIFGNFNWENANPVAQEIGRKQFAQQVRALGLPGIQSLDDLINLPFDGKVGIQKSKDPQYEDSNRVTAFVAAGSKSGGEQVTQPVAATQRPARPAAQAKAAPQRPARPAPQRPQPASAAPARGKMPWEQATADANGFNPADDDIPF